MATRADVREEPASDVLLLVDREFGPHDLAKEVAERRGPQGEGHRPGVDLVRSIGVLDVLEGLLRGRRGRKPQPHRPRARVARCARRRSCARTRVAPRVPRTSPRWCCWCGCPAERTRGRRCSGGPPGARRAAGRRCRDPCPGHGSGRWPGRWSAARRRRGGRTRSGLSSSGEASSGRGMRTAMPSRSASSKSTIHSIPGSIWRSFGSAETARLGSGPAASCLDTGLLVTR